jgi:hypothetical protein
MAINFDAVNKLAILSPGTTILSVQDLWSRWVDWWLTSDNSGIAPMAMVQIGGNDIDVAAGTSIPSYIYLTNGWRVRPQEASHTLSVSTGVLLVDGGGDPFVDTLGSYVVRINYQQPVQAITVSTGGGGGSGLTLQQVRDAMALSTSQPIVTGSIDYKLAHVQVSGVDSGIVVDANIKKVNNISVNGTGAPGDTWGP